MKIETVLGMLCLCKQPQSRWTRRTNFARTRRVPQEANEDRALSSSMIANGSALAVRRANRPRVARRGTMFEGLRKPTELIVIVVTLLAYGCPLQAIVHAYGLDERTVAAWRDRAGIHCQKVHQAMVEQGKLDLMHVQADEIRVKARGMIAWMGLAMMVSTRLWLAGLVSQTRDSRLADWLLQQVRRCSEEVVLASSLYLIRPNLNDHEVALGRSLCARPPVSDIVGEFKNQARFELEFVVFPSVKTEFANNILVGLYR